MPESSFYLPFISRGVQTSGISAPLWKSKSCFGPHIKYTAKCNRKKISVFQVNLWFHVGSCSQPSWAACGPWAMGRTSLTLNVILAFKTLSSLRTPSTTGRRKDKERVRQSQHFQIQPGAQARLINEVQPLHKMDSQMWNNEAGYLSYIIYKIQLKMN